MKNAKESLLFVGQKINKLMIVMKTGNKIENDPTKKDNIRYRDTYLCVCECGNLKSVKGYCLIKNEIKTCGECYTKSDTPLIISAKRLYRERYSNGDLLFEDFYKLSQMNCNYCGRKPMQAYNYHRCGKRRTSQFAKDNGKFVYNGLDRVDNDKGHNKDNVVPCCKICNYAKSNMSIDEFRIWATNLYNNWVLGKDR